MDKSSSPAGLGQPPQAGVGIFVKAPRPGEVKTRLCPPLTHREAAAFYAAALTETVTRLAAGPLPVTLFVAGDRGWFSGRFPGLEQQSQRGADLGVRMTHALELLLGRGGPAILVGSDSPDLPLELVTAAAAALQRTDVVAAPAGDGGYVLLGVRRCPPGLLLDIPWSTPQVLVATRERARRHGLGWQELAGWEDVDDWAGLQRLLARSPGSATAGHVRRHLGRLRTAIASPRALSPAAGTGGGDGQGG